ncbi:DNA end-binding protein Ku [Rhizobiales bacterium GAS191]|nr:DNA end-binding protein Ku [Rhizobiales bacterium GAS188]SEE29997.1 DNA end-binding protein Ku [Rhizobiales bacterium GAS191]
MAPRSNWKGFLKLSLVSCSIALYPAASSSARITFNTLNRKTGNRLKRQFVDAETGEEVDTEDQVKGFRVDRDNYLMIEETDLDEIRIESTHTIEIEKFVPKAEIDPRYMDAPYYIAPTEKVGEEAFAVIRDAMRDEKVVGLGRAVISRRERIMMIEPWDKGLLGTVLRYAYEVRGEEAYFSELPSLKLDADLNDMAKVIIKRKFGHFDPTEFTDRYEDAIAEMVRGKQAGSKPRLAKSAPSGGNVINLMDALRRSMEASGAAQPKRSAEAPAQSPSAQAPSAASKKRANAKQLQRDQPQLKLPIPGGKSKPAGKAKVEAPKEEIRPSSRKKAS